MVTRRLLSVFSAMLGAVLAVTCVYVATRIPAYGAPEAATQVWCCGLALLQLFPIVGGAHWVRRESGLGFWLLWFVPSLVIMLCGSWTAYAIRYPQ